MCHADEHILHRSRCCTRCRISYTGRTGVHIHLCEGPVQGDLQPQGVLGTTKSPAPICSARHELTLQVSERERLPPPPGGPFGWLVPLWTTSNKTLIEKCGLDAFFFLRYLRVQLKIFLPAACITLPILLPLNTTGGGKREALYRQSFSNVDGHNASRLWMHLICAVSFIAWVCYCVFHEFAGYIRIRQTYLTSPQHRLRASATTVLVSGIPPRWRTLAALNGLFDVLPGGIHTIWVNRDYSELAKKIAYRGEIAANLEYAETALIKQCYKNDKKIADQEGRKPSTQQLSTGGISTGAHTKTSHGMQDVSKPQSPGIAAGHGLDGTDDGRSTSVPFGREETQSQMEVEEPRPQEGISKLWHILRHDTSLYLPSPQPHASDDSGYPPIADQHEKTRSKNKTLGENEYPVAFNTGCDEDQDNEAEWRRFVSPADRQTTRLPVLSWLPSIPFVGQKVDSIYWYRRELARLNLEIETDQSNADKYPYMNSAFIQFSNQAAAHICCQSLIHHLPQAMTPRIVEISPNDVLWDNLSMTWWERYLRVSITLISCAALIVLYAFPVAFTGLLSNIDTIAKVTPGLGWLADLPGPFKSGIQGLLPQLILIVLLLLIPVIFRALIHQQGVPTGNAKEKGVQAWFFAFLFIQVFFVVTLSTGLLPFLQQFQNNPTELFRSLATSIPPAANYFFSYLTVTALNNSASNLLQPVGLLSWLVLARVQDSTAREKWSRQTEPNTITWGSFFPLFTNFAAIGLVYSITAPLIQVFMLLIFGLFTIVYRYNILFVYRSTNDTGGLLFPVALNQMFTGLYILEICLIGLFFSVQDGNTFRCIPQAAIMIVVLVGTVLFQWQLSVVFEPLFRYLPITLEDDAVVRDEQWAKAEAEGKHRVRVDIGKAQRTLGDDLYANYADELEDLSPDERQAAVRSAFQPEALRATRPVIWIPRDPLGVSDDEIRRAGKMSTVMIENADGVKEEKTHIWMSNEGATLDAKGRVEFSAPPPDFSSRDLIVL